MLVCLPDQQRSCGPTVEEMGLRTAPREVFAHAPNLKAEIGRRTVREQISDKLASLVASGILQVGDELPSERELASLLDVSRETVRGAIQTLAAIGVVAVSQGARTRVVSRKIDTLKIGVTSPSAINAYDLESVHKARLLIERAVAAEAASRIDDDTLARLKQSLAIQKQTTRDPVHFLICDREFHITIYRSSGNPFARRLRDRPLCVHARPQEGRSLAARRHREELSRPCRDLRGAEGARSSGGDSGVRPAYRPDLRHDRRRPCRQAEGEERYDEAQRSSLGHQSRMVRQSGRKP